MNEESIISTTLQQPPADRLEFLKEACGGDDALFERLRARLAGNDETDLFGSRTQPFVSGAPAAAAEGPAAGTIVAGRFKLLECLGEGGMGTVYLAEQTVPVRRKVALKLIKPGMDSKSVLARFEAERQALALMDHPNIARVLDGGIVQGESGSSSGGVGRSFFVMEYIRGIPLTDYCDAAKVSIRQRLSLFVSVCQAVQHAHQKGIIHRDLKPSNILVALYDGRPIPKVIDFGLAKAMHQPLTERSLHTGHHVAIGTPLYMSPEQSELNNLDVDTRSDIYSLGVILYELLTGTTPLDRERFKRAAWDERMRLIREEEPAKPSMRISKADTLASVAAKRHTEPAKLSKLIRGDLDWIVMKALAKERDRRYDTANSFAADIERFLQNEPVAAGPPTLRYKLRKFVRRNRGQVIAASLVLLALVAGIAGTSIGLLRAVHERDLKEEARRDAVASAEAARAAERDRRIELSKTASAAAKLAAQRGQWKEALIHYQSALDLGGADEIGLKLGRFDCRMALSRYSEARADLEELTSRTDLGDYTGIVLLERAFVALIDKSAGDPQALVKQALAAGLPPADAAYAQVFFDQNISQVIDHLKEALRADPFHSRSLDTLPSVLMLSGRRDELRESIAQLRTLRHDSLSEIFYQLLMHAIDRDSTSVERDLVRLEKSENALFVPMARVYAEMLMVAQDEEFSFQGMSAEQATKALNQLPEVAALYGQLKGKKDSDKQLISEMPMMHLPFVKPLFESPFVKAFERGGGLEVILLAVQPSKLADVFNEIVRTIPDGAFLEMQGEVLQRAGRLREAERAFTRAVASPSMANHRRRAWLGLTEVQWELANDPKTPDAERPQWRQKAMANARDLAYSGPLNKSLYFGLLPVVRNGDDPVLALALSEAWLRQRPDEQTTSVNKCAAELQIGANRRAEKTAWEFLDQKSPDEKTALQMLAMLNQIGFADYGAGHFQDACRVFERLYPLSVVRLGPGHEQTLIRLHNLAMSQRRAGRLPESLRNFEVLGAAVRQHMDPSKSERIEYLGRWIAALEEDKQFARALEQRQLLLSDQRKAFLDDDPRLATALIELADAGLNNDQSFDAEPLVRECLSIREKKTPDDWLTFNARSRLGGLLLEQKRYAEAEPLLVSGYEGLKQREASIPANVKKRLREAVERLVQFSEATGKLDEAAKWRKKLEEVKKAAATKPAEAPKP